VTPARWLVAGEWQYEHYEHACAAALERCGVAVTPFSWAETFRSPAGRVERWATAIGPVTRRMQAALTRAARDVDASVVLVWRGTHVNGATVRALRNGGTRTVIAYNNDDPFSPAYAQGSWAQRRLWRTFRHAIPDYDLHCCYRPHNVRELQSAGARAVHLLMPWYVPGLDRPMTLSPAEQAAWDCDVVFIGHYENDGRQAALLALADAGVRVRLYGTGWGAAELGALAAHVGTVAPVRGEAYRLALSGARIALCFLSRLNRDRYTRRNFEIPACGTAMVSERTPELCAIFQDGVEAGFFSSTAELIEIVQALLRDPARRIAMARAGRARLDAGGHSVDGRMRELLTVLGRTS
jgi:spore maturation protein CgeB